MEAVITARPHWQLDKLRALLRAYSVGFTEERSKSFWCGDQIVIRVSDPPYGLQEAITDWADLQQADDSW